MKLYLSIITIAMFIISVINISFNTTLWYNVIIAVVLCTAAQFVLDGIIALIINRLPNKLFSEDNHFYRVSKIEIKLYKKLKVSNWKDKIWELGGLGGFSKRSILNPNSPEYVKTFITECNKGVLTHRLSYPIGFIPMLLIPNICSFTIALPVAVVNLFLNILPTMVLRYNTPKLKTLLKRINKKV